MTMKDTYYYVPIDFDLSQDRRKTRRLSTSLLPDSYFLSRSRQPYIKMPRAGTTQIKIAASSLQLPIRKESSLDQTPVRSKSKLFSIPNLPSDRYFDYSSSNRPKINHKLSGSYENLENKMKVSIRITTTDSIPEPVKSSSQVNQKVNIIYLDFVDLVLFLKYYYSIGLRVLNFALC